MGFIENEANRFYDEKIDDELDNFNDYYPLLELEAGQVNREDRAEFYNVLLARVTEEREEHRRKCKNPATCEIIRGADKFEYYLRRDIQKASLINPLPVDQDTFSAQEKADLNKRIDEILVKLNELGLGQEILYDEIQELKNLQDLDKKTFRQVVLGKLGDVLMGEAASQIAETLEENNLSLPDIYSFIMGTVKKSLPPTI